MDVSTMIGDVKFNYRAGLWITKNDKILIEFNPADTHVTIPGGRVKTLESSLEGLKREIAEEMQIEIQDDEVELKGMIESFFPYDGKKYHEIYFVYKLDVQEGDPRFCFKGHMRNYDSKASYYQWVDQDRLEEVNLLPVALRDFGTTSSFIHAVEDDLKGKNKKHV